MPYLTGRVNDYAGLIDDATEGRIEEQLRALEEANGAQVAVLTIISLEGEPLEDFSLRVAETWALGREGVDDGVLLLIARDDRKMRLEVGYGLEDRLPDIVSGRILNNILRPAFRQGDFSGGIENAVGAITGTIRGDDVVPDQAPSSRADDIPSLAGRGMMFLFFLFMVGIFSVAALFSTGCSSWFLYLFLTPFYFTFPTVLLSPPTGWIFGGGWLILFPILKMWLGKTAAGRGFAASHPKWINFGSSGGGGWGGGGFSGGGFSGGGGSFGGGGASSSW